MLLKSVWLLALIDLACVHALPAELRRVPRALGSGKRQNSGGNQSSAKIIIPIVLAVVFFLMLLIFGWWRRRRRLRQAVTASTTNARTAASSSTTPAAASRTTTSTRTPITAPGTGPDAPPRPPRRRRRRRPSQISTKSLPAYNEQAGDEEIVLVRRAERDSMSDDDEDDDDNSRDPRHSRHGTSGSVDATPLLDDASPEMGQVSLASSTRGRSFGDHSEQDNEQDPTRSSHDTSTSPHTTTENAIDNSPAPAPAPALVLPSNTEETSATNAPLDDAPTYTEATASGHGHAGATQESTDSQPSETAADSAEGSSTGPAAGNTIDDAFVTIRPKRKSVFRQLFALNKPGSTSTAAPESVELSPTSPRQSLSVASATQGTGRHRPSNSISTLASTTAASGRGHALTPSLSSLLLTRSRSPTRSSDSLAQRLNISAPIPTTLIRTELSYPRSGPTPEQIRFLSSRESLGRFGVPYGEEAVAAAARSRENISSMVSPPLYEGPSTENATSEALNVTVTPSSRMRGSTLSIVHTPTTESAPLAEEEEEASQPAPSPHEHVGTSGNNERSGSVPVADQAASPADSAMPNNDRRDSMLSANSFVTANESDVEAVAEGGREEDASDGSPPTPTAETYRQAEADGDATKDATIGQTRPRGQTILIPGSRSDDADHPELTFIPATPTVDVPARDDRVS